MIMSSSESESESSESSSSRGGEEEVEGGSEREAGASGGASDERGLCVCLFIIIIGVLLVFSSPLCFCVSKRSTKLSLSPLSDRAGPLDDYTNSSETLLNADSRPFTWY